MTTSNWYADALFQEVINTDLGRIVLVRIPGGYWHWGVKANNGRRGKSDPPQAACWFGHWSRRAALRTARKRLKALATAPRQFLDDLIAERNG